MMKKTTIIIITGLLFLFPISAYTSGLSGKITDSETNNLIRDVNIRIVETGIVAASDEHGIYKFGKLQDGTYHIVATHIAYDTSDTLVVSLSGEQILNIKLNPSPWVLNDVVVTGTRSPHLLKDVPVQTEVVTRRDFDRTGAKTVDEALNSSIGININEDLSGKGATIRGIEGDRVLILVDGERAVGRVRGTIDLSQFSLNNVEKIEIVKGTGSTLYGSDAMGGVINIITKKPKKSTGLANINFDYGTHNKINPALDLEYGNDQLAFNLGGKYFSTDGFDLWDSTSHTEGQEDIEQVNLFGKTSYRLSEKWSSTLSSRYMYEKKLWIEDDERYINDIEGIVRIPHDDDETNKRFESSLNFDYLSGDKYSMKFRLFGSLYKHNWNKITRLTEQWIDTSDTKDLFLEASYTSNYVIGQNHVATYGIDYNYQDLTSTELISTKEADKSFSSYLQYEYQPHEHWNVIIGNRYEWHSSFGGHFNPSINIMHKPNERIKVRGFVGKGFRAPSIKEQYFVFDHSSAGYIVYGGFAADPNSFEGTTFETLEQENSINSAISAELSYGTIGLHRFTFFYNHLEGLIDFKLIDFNEGYYRGRYVYQNIETAITKGIEWESRVRLSESFDFSFSYNYLLTRNLETQTELRNRPRNTVKFFLTGYLKDMGVGGSFYGDYHSRKIWIARTNTGGNEDVDAEGNIIADHEYAPERTTLNLNLFKRFDDLEIFMRMENLLDQVEVEYGYWPGFEIFFGFKYSFKNK